MSALSTLQADTVELTAKEARFRLAFKSRPQTAWHCSHSKTLSGEHLTYAMSINAYSRQQLENLQLDHKEK